MEVINLKNANYKDCYKLAEIHINAFPGFFLSSLGKSFLQSFYHAVLKHSLGIGVGLIVDGQIAGFAIGTTRAAGFYRSLLVKQGHVFLLKAFTNLIVSPKKLKRLVLSSRSSEGIKYLNLPSLLSICISPHHKSRGMGTMLLEKFESQLIDKNFKELILTTDSDQNAIVNQFYKRNNYVCVQTFLQGTRRMNLYHKTIKI